MKRVIKTSLALAASVAAIAGTMAPAYVSAWGDNGGGRPSYTKDQINKGAIGKYCNPESKDYAKCIKDKNFPGTIVFNSISDSTIGNEKNFVGTRECTVQANGRCNAATKETIWNANEIEVKDGQTYIVRSYIHNNNPNGESAVAENTMVSFEVPGNTANEIKVSSVINSSNATPSRYWDGVVFKSDRAFHLEYVYGSAIFTNNSVGKGGLSVGDEVVTNAANGGMLIGYDKLDGRIPGCYQYDSFVTIQVKAVFDDFMVEKKVRLAGEKTWQDTVTANVGDKVEFQIQYKNTSNKSQTHVVLRDILPPNLRYVPGSTKLMDAKYPNGATINEDVLVGDNGFLIGDYAAGANAYVMFTAEVVDDSLACGQNTLINKGQAYVNDKLLEDRANVVTNKVCEDDPTPPTPPTPEEPKPTLPTTGPSMMVGGIVATGSIATAAGYYIVSRRQLKR